MKYNIAIIPQVDVEERAKIISEKIADHGGMFILGDENKAHITIAHFICDDPEILSVLTTDVEKMCKGHTSFDMIQKSYRIHDGWIDVQYRETAQMTKLYNAVCDILRTHACEKTSRDWSENPPHLTFSRIAQTDDAFDLSQLPMYDLSFHAQHIGLYTLGEHGTNNSLLHIFML